MAYRIDPDPHLLSLHEAARAAVSDTARDLWDSDPTARELRDALVAAWIAGARHVEAARPAGRPVDERQVGDLADLQQDAKVVVERLDRFDLAPDDMTESEWAHDLAEAAYVAGRLDERRMGGSDE